LFKTDSNMGVVRVFLETIAALSCIRINHAALINENLLAKEFATIAKDGMGVSNMQV